MAACTVSVIIPVRDGAATIAAALRSVRPQLGPGDEVLVIDDRSRDETVAIVRRESPDIHLLTAEAAGVSAARNTGLRAARGELVAFLDGDDLWPPDRHGRLRACLAADPALHAAAGRLRFLYQDGAEPVADGERIDGRHAPSILMTCLYRRGFLRQVGLFDESLRYGEDVDYHWRLVDAGMRLALVEADALVYRRHAGNATNRAPSRRSIMMALLARRAARHRRRDHAAAGTAA